MKDKLLTLLGFATASYQLSNLQRYMYRRGDMKPMRTRHHQLTHLVTQLNPTHTHHGTENQESCQYGCEPAPQNGPHRHLYAPRLDEADAAGKQAHTIKDMGRT